MKAYCAWDAASRMLSMLAEGERPHRKGRPADKQERGKPQLMTISSSSFQLDVVREREKRAARGVRRHSRSLLSLRLKEESVCRQASEGEECMRLHEERQSV